MDNTLGSSFTNNSCNDSTLSIFDSTPRCMLFSVSDSFTLPSNETSPPELNTSGIKASTSTPSFANDSYSDIIKVRPPKTYTLVDHSAPLITSPSPKRGLQQSPHGLIKTQNRLVSSLPHKESPLVKNSISTLQSSHNSNHKAVPTSLSHPKNISSSSVSSINSDDDLFFEQLTTFQNTLENSVTTSTSPGPKIADLDTLLTGEIISHKPSPSSKSNSPLKDPTNKFCLSTYQLGDINTSQPLTECAVGNVSAQKECKTESLKVNEVSEEKEKENSVARGVVSAIKPTQILPHWGGSGKTRSVQKRVTFENKLKEDIKSKNTSNIKHDNHTPTRPQTRWKKVRSAPSLPCPSSDSTECLTINSRIWCPTACATNSTVDSPSNLQPKRVCRGGSTPPEFPVSPAVMQIVLRSNSSPANTSLNSNISGDELIGDNSESHLLPVIRGSNPDLKTIESLTLVRVLAGEFAQHISNLVIVDARYPYEYKGGHINTALNIWTEQLMYEFFLKSAYVPISNLRHIIVFYCEFSTMRGPSQYRYLRNEDRKLNEATFPKLHYPELYVLNGGYARFFSTSATTCSPCCYVKMLDEEYKQEMAKCQILKHQGSRRAVSATCRVARPSKSNCRRKQKFQ